MGGLSVIGLPAWLIGVLSSWAISFEVGSAATLGYAVQWALKAPERVANWIAPVVVLLGGASLYIFVLGHPPTFPITNSWVSGLVLWIAAALGVGSAAGHTGGAPATNSIKGGVDLKPIAGMLLLVAAIVLAAALPARAAEVFKANAAVNSVWLDGPGTEFPADVEAGATASASLSPHISLVGLGVYGFSNSYLRWNGGVRVAATDVENPNFNVFLGLGYRGGSTSAVQPNEWAPDAGVGWKPSPKSWPRLTLGADAGYGLESKRVLAYLALRYSLSK